MVQAFDTLLTRMQGTKKGCKMIRQSISLDMVKKAATFAQNHYIKDGDVSLDDEKIYFYSPSGVLLAWVRRDAKNGRRPGSYCVLGERENK